MNVYTLDRCHVGKRWAAGVWCWDCRASCLYELDNGTRIRGEDMRPFGPHRVVAYVCPHCGAVKPNSDAVLPYNPVMRELGVDKRPPQEHHGIDGASGWIWCTDPETGLGASAAEIRAALKRRRFVITEYRQRWPMAQFWAMFRDIITESECDRNFS